MHFEIETDGSLVIVTIDGTVSTVEGSDRIVSLARYYADEEGVSSVYLVFSNIAFIDEYCRDKIIEAYTILNQRGKVMIPAGLSRDMMKLLEGTVYTHVLRTDADGNFIVTKGLPEEED